jgi:long-subunit acyl-CoA synthetase (AMP-forming)
VSATTEPGAAATICEAFAATVARHPRQVVLRTPGRAVTITWEQYAGRVRQIAAGLTGLGVRRGDTVALMITNRPEFHLVDTAAFHLGALPFSVYNTFAPEQIRHALPNAGSQVAICEEQFRAAAAGRRRRHRGAARGVRGRQAARHDHPGAAGGQRRPSVRVSRPAGGQCSRVTCSR